MRFFPFELFKAPHMKERSCLSCIRNANLLSSPKSSGVRLEFALFVHLESQQTGRDPDTLGQIVLGVPGASFQQSQHLLVNAQ